MKQLLWRLLGGQSSSSLVARRCILIHKWVWLIYLVCECVFPVLCSIDLCVDQVGIHQVGER